MKLHLLLMIASLVPIAASRAQVQSAPPRPPAAPSPDAVEIEYAYDAAGRLIEVIYGGSTTVRYTYDPSGNLLSIVTTPMPLTAAPPDESARRARLLALLGPRQERIATQPLLPFLEAIGPASGVMRYSAKSPGLSSSFFR